MGILYIAGICLGVTFFINNKLPKNIIVVIDIAHTQVQRQTVIVRLDTICYAVFFRHTKTYVSPKVWLLKHISSSNVKLSRNTEPPFILSMLSY